MFKDNYIQHPFIDGFFHQSTDEQGPTHYTPVIISTEREIFSVIQPTNSFTFELFFPVLTKNRATC